MDNKNPPPLSNFRDDDDEDSKHSVDISKHSDDDDDDMSVAVPPPPQPFASSPGSASGPQPSAANNTKRYRPAPAKTFQCRGYGECRMVFSRSEHLARHIRKHTGERPFTCHCGKQFSRLDNLRQHAQTVHADKQEQNDRMMHDLTSLHATMTAASKGGAPRGKRAQAAAAAAAAAAANGGSSNNNSPALDGGLPSIKSSGGGAQDALSMSMRPGTSTGYEGGNAIPFVTPASPFVSPQHPQQLQQHSINSTPNIPASPFSPPHPPHSASVSPISNTLPQEVGQELAAVLLQPQQQTIDPSRPSLPSSPHPSLPPSLSRNHPRSSSRSSVSSSNTDQHQHRSHPPMYYHYQTQHMPSVDDQQQPIAPAPHLHRTTITSLQDLDHPQQQAAYHPWSPLAPNYPYPSPRHLDGAHHQHSAAELNTARYTDPSEMSQQQQAASEETSPHLLLDTTHPFPSTLPQTTHRRLPHQRPSPPSHHPQHHRPSPILVNGPMHQDPTSMTMTTISSPASVHEEMYAHLAAAAAAGGAGQVQGMSTAQTLGHSLDGSPSWNSAMTPILSQQLDHLYHYQAQRQHSVSAPAAHHALPHRQDSSLVHRNSLSTIAPHPPTPPQHHQQQQQVQVPSQRSASTPVGPRQYSLELRRQQEEQMRRIREQRAAEQQLFLEESHERRNSEEEQYIMHMSGAGAYPPAHQNANSHHTNVNSIRRRSPHVHHYFPHHPQSQQQQVQAVYGGDLPLQDEESLDRLELDIDGQQYPHQVEMTPYHLVDGHQLRLGPLSVEGSPTGMIKYESSLE